MFKKMGLILVAFAMLFVSSLSFASEYGSRDDVVALTKKAAAYVEEHGKEKALAELNNPEGMFIDRDLYVMAADLEEGTRLAHPYKKGLLGKTVFDAKDIDGKPYGEEIMEIAMEAGEGWVAYKFTDPTTQKIAQKEAYVVKAGDLILYCGFYQR